MKAIQCRQCSAVFSPTVRNQSYCPTCREVRESERQAKEAAKKCNRCGGHDGVRWGLCRHCKAQQKQEDSAHVERIEQRKIARFGLCRQCGVYAAHPQKDGLCGTCEFKRRNKTEKARKFASLDHDTKRQKFDEGFKAASLEAQARVLLILFTKLMEAYGKEEEETRAEVDTNPEQVDAPNQDAIDTTFNDLMAGFDL